MVAAGGRAHLRVPMPADPAIFLPGPTDTLPRHERRDGGEARPGPPPHQFAALG